jgi:hypothetical protein
MLLKLQVKLEEISLHGRTRNKPPVGGLFRKGRRYKVSSLTPCKWSVMKDSPEPWEEACQHVSVNGGVAQAVKQGHGSFFRCGNCHFRTFNKYYERCPNQNCEGDAVFVALGYEYGGYNDGP